MRLCDMSRPTTHDVGGLGVRIRGRTASRSMPFGAAMTAAREPRAFRSASAVWGEAAMI